MRQVLFVQGGGEGVHDAWDNKLVASLRRELGSGFEVRYPRMPNETDPRYAGWKTALVKEIGALDAGAIVVAHSIGGTIFINVLAELERTPNLSAVLLIAPPFIGDGGWPSADIAPMGDLGARLASTMPVILFQGDADETTPHSHAALYAKAIPQLCVRRLKGRDHQIDNDLSEVAGEIRRQLKLL